METASGPITSSRDDCADRETARLRRRLQRLAQFWRQAMNNYINDKKSLHKRWSHFLLSRGDVLYEMHIHGRVQWWEFLVDETRIVQYMTNFHIGRVHEYVYHAAQQCTKCLLDLFSRVHSTSFVLHCSIILRSLSWPWWHSSDPDEVWSWQFQINTCVYKTCFLSCMIIIQNILMFNEPLLLCCWSRETIC